MKTPRDGRVSVVRGAAGIVGLLACIACGTSDAPPAQTESKTPPAGEGNVAPPASGVVAPVGTAKIAGTVRFNGTPPRLPPIRMDADPGCSKKHSGPVSPDALVLGEGQTMGNVMITIEKGLPAGSYPVPADAVVLDQTGCRYEPHVLAVRVGQPFRILNSDGLLHNVHSLPKANAGFNRAMPANVKEAEYRFDTAEPAFRIKCDVHPWMGAWVAVLEHPYSAVTGADGAFVIEGLPAGEYTVQAWHERLGTQDVQVTVADGASANAEFTFSR